MTVVPQTYTATATWTATQLADIFKQAFIDAGLMTDWFDTFLNTVENRVLRVINDGAKANGTVYYWFMFATNGVFVQTTSTWNTSTHVPTGTQYLDYYQSATNTTGNHLTLLALSNTSNCTVTRYTSGINSAATIFLIRNGTNNRTFMLSHPSYNASAFVDQDKVQFNALYRIASFGTTNNTASIGVAQLFHTRKSYLGAMALNGAAGSQFFRAVHVHSVWAPGNSSAAFNVDDVYAGLVLPVAENNTNSALAADHTPVFTAPTISPYMAALPSDFGFAAYYASSTMALQDTLVVSSGTEEWEMIALSINAGASCGRLLFCARTI